MSNTTTKISAPFPVNVATFDAVDVRRTVVAALLPHTTSATQAVAGMLAGSAATYDGTNVIVPEALYALNAGIASNGTYLVHADRVQFQVPAADSTYGRIDNIYIQILDNYIDAGGVGGANIVYNQGVATTNPAAPAVPSNSTLLATVTVPKSGSGTATLAYNMPQTSLATGVITCTSTARPSGALLKVGTLIYETDTGLVKSWTGSAWSQLTFRDRVSIVTSTTHPAQPQPGDIIYETDTGKSSMYSGSQWVGLGGAAKLVVSGTRPANPAAGDLCYETDTNNLYVYTGSAWSLAGGDAKVVTAGVRPSNPVVGDIAFESDTNRLYVYTSSGWVLASNQSSSVASTARPSNPVAGDLIIESDTQHIQVYNGSKWIPSGTIMTLSTSTGSRPSKPLAGDMLFETDTLHTLVYTGSSWTLTTNSVFAVTSTTRPAHPANGDMIWETDTYSLMLYSFPNGGWVKMAGGVNTVSTSTTHPSSPRAGDLTYDTDTADLMVYAGGAWVNTSDVVNSGSNSNGYYVQFSDGTMIAYLNTSQAIAFTAYGSLYTGSYTWTYPVAFKSVPQITCGCFLWGTGASWPASANGNVTNCTLRGIDVAARANTTNTLINAVAVGRWK